MKYKITMDAGLNQQVISFVEEGHPNIEFIIQNMIDATKCLQYSGYGEHPLKGKKNEQT